MWRRYTVNWRETPILTIWLGLAFLTSFMIFSKSAVSSACFWVCKAIFSLNFLGFDMADKLAVALLLCFLSQCLQRPSHHLVLLNHYRGLWIVNYASNTSKTTRVCLALSYTRLTTFNNVTTLYTVQRNCCLLNAVIRNSTGFRLNQLECLSIGI